MTDKLLDVHLMIEAPERYIESFRAAGAGVITVHYEACTHLHRTLQQIRATGAKAGVALNPHTPVAFLSDIIGEIDLVCLMSVNPGYGGQQFIPQTVRKTKQLADMLRVHHSNALIEIDGGSESIQCCNFTGGRGRCTGSREYGVWLEGSQRYHLEIKKCQKDGYCLSK
jgi:ribulose-phosphate 3-epimerase